MECQVFSVRMLQQAIVGAGALLLLCLGEVPVAAVDLQADTWVATDGLGRHVPGLAEAGPRRPDRVVGIFYWTWHRRWSEAGPHDVTQLLATASDGKVDWPPQGVPYHWGEPELGYYVMTDPFVLRKHASMLADAGVDFVAFDTTNGSFTWRAEYEVLCRTWSAMRREGNSTPAIVFMCPFGDPRPVLHRIWHDLYQPGLWQDLWLQWDGKPLVLADRSYVQDPELLEFFSWRRVIADYRVGPTAPQQWSWLEVYPQHGFFDREGRVEQVSVSVAENALLDVPGPAPMSHRDGAMGRSWHQGRKDLYPCAVQFGFNFDEQWWRAMALDPEVVFVTGWNEWTSGRYYSWYLYTDEDAYYPGGLFVDQYNQEYSRDCEPMVGGHTDNYYYQLASWIREYKGVRPRPKADGPSAIVIDGVFDDWEAVQPVYYDTIGDVTHRDHRGYGTLHYVNETGRNDIVQSRAAYGDEQLYFLVQTREPLTPSGDPMWMLLLLDSDHNAATGWLGYDYVLNRQVVDATTTTLEVWTGGQWQGVGPCAYRAAGNRLELAVPRRLLGQAAGRPSFDFHWADNIQSFAGVAELGLNGDSAPNRRWNYRYQVAP